MPENGGARTFVRAYSHGGCTHKENSWLVPEDSLSVATHSSHQPNKHRPRTGREI